MLVATTIAAVLAIAAAPAGADSSQVRRGPVPDWVTPSELMAVPSEPGGLVFVRRQDTLVHLDEKGLQTYVGYRIKILHSSALELGNLSVAWNPAAGAPTVHTIRIHRDGEAIDVLDGASFEILRRENQLEAATLDGILTAILRVEDLRVDDELEVEVTIRSSDPTLGANDAGLLLLAPDPSPGRLRLGVSWDEGQQPRVKITQPMADAATRRPGAIDFRFDNAPILMPPKDAPPRYVWQRVAEFSDFADWNALSRQLAPLFAKAAMLDATSPVRSEARRIAAAHADPLSRAAAALKLVQQQVRYIYVGLDGGNLTPATAAETWQRRYGDCKGKTALLLALLAELGIEAEPVLVSNAGADDGLDQRLPTLRMFDHVLVRARIGGADYWLDGTLPPVAEPTREPVVPYRWVLPLTASGSTIVALQWTPPERPTELTEYEMDARGGFDEPAKITTRMIVRGVEGLKQQAQFSALSPATLLTTLRQEMVGDFWQSIDDVNWRYDVDAQASILTISGTGEIDWDDDGGGKRSLTLPGGGFSPPQKRVRPADQDQSAPFYNEPEFDCRVTTVRLPETTDESQWSFNSSFADGLFGRTYYRAFELRDGAIRMVRGTRVEEREIEPGAAARDNARIADFDNSMAVISFDPAGEEPAPEPGDPVPATYEIDWTADDVPCAPRSTSGEGAAAGA